MRVWLEVLRNNRIVILSNKTKNVNKKVPIHIFVYLGSTGNATGYSSPTPIPAILATSPAQGPAAFMKNDASIGYIRLSSADRI